MTLLGEASRRGKFGWAMFDWANQPFFTLITTFIFAPYFVSFVVGDAVRGQALWGYTQAFAGVVIALAAPFLGSIADAGGRRKPWIGVFTALGVAGACALWYATPAADPGGLAFTMAMIVVATIGVEFAIVFNNAMLPSLVGEARIGLLSGFGWGLGYVGGLACLAVSLVAFVQPDPALFGLDRDAAEHVRVTAFLVAAWYLVFALPLFALMPDRPASGLAPAAAVAQGLRQLRGTLSQLSRHRNIARFLLARMIYTDGLNTLFAFGGIYAAGSFGMSFEEILIFGILLNAAAGLGAVGFAWVDDWIGAKRTAMIAVGALTLFTSVILLVDDKLWFYILGCLIGSMIGPAQSASRSLMARLAPAELRTEMFGLYALSGKATAFIGPALVGWLTLWAGSQRVGMSAIIVFFALGLVLLAPVRET